MKLIVLFRQGSLLSLKTALLEGPVSNYSLKRILRSIIYILHKQIPQTKIGSQRDKSQWSPPKLLIFIKILKRTEKRDHERRLKENWNK